MKKVLTTYLALSFLVCTAPVSGQEKVRVEKDLLGEKSVPVDVTRCPLGTSSRP